MRLLNVYTKIPQRFEDDEGRPPYAILSHTWDTEGGELTLQELQDAGNLEDFEGQYHPLWSKSGFRKMWMFCQIAAKDGHEWVWMDTCLIDSASSAELSEAINSMYRWYKDSQSCYIYLEDVSGESDRIHGEKSEFRESRWFTRGWTLQEYIAPTKALFFNSAWSCLGERSLLASLVSEITGIPSSLFPNVRLAEFSIAQRMSWAANRKTSRKEDLAYCLLGLFDINMVPLYGEGLKAFQRLQKEIITDSHDQTIFAWGFNKGKGTDERESTGSVLAQSPADFSGCQEVIPCKHLMPQKMADYEMTKNGVKIELPLLQPDDTPTLDLAILNCRPSDEYRRLIAIPLMPIARDTSSATHGEVWKRRRATPPRLVRLDVPMSWRLGYLQVNAREDTAEIIHDKLNGSTFITVPAYMYCRVLSLGHSVQVHRDSADILIVREKELSESKGTSTTYFSFQPRATSSSTVAFLMRLDFFKEASKNNSDGDSMLIRLAPSTSPFKTIPRDVLTSLKWESKIDFADESVNFYIAPKLMKYKYGFKVRNVTVELQPRRERSFGRVRTA